MEIERSDLAYELFREELILCKVGADKTVAILAPEGSMYERAQTFLHAARSLGARSYIVTVPWHTWGAGTTGSTTLGDYPELMGALKSADLVVDLVKLLFSDVQLELQAAGCGVLMCVEPLAVLQRLFPTVETRALVESEGRLLSAAKELSVVSDRGTDVRYQLGPYPVLMEYGYTDEPGRWDHWPGGFALTHARDDGVDGVVVLGPGDLLLLPVPRMIRDRVELHIEGGYITHIVGDNLDATYLRDFLRPADDANDRDAYAVSHIGWGCNRAAKWSLWDIPGSLHQDARAYYGNVLFSTGPNREVGGSRTTPYHLDIPLRDCSVLLDGTLVVEQGRILGDA